MRKAIRRRRLGRTISLLAFMSLGAGAIVSAPAAVAAGPAIVEGATVRADNDSPTGYTVEFVYHNPNATQVRLAPLCQGRVGHAVVREI
jgi:hypothetical protein